MSRLFPPALFQGASLVADPMPAQASLVEWLVAGDIAQADGSAVTGWTGRKTGLTYTATASPLYRTSRQGAKPAVTFNGSQWLTIGRPAWLTSLLAQATANPGYTICFIAWIDPTQSGTFRGLWSPSDFNDGRSILLGNNSSGGKGSNRSFSAGGFHVFTIRSSSIVTNNSSALFYQDMNGYAGANGTLHATNNYTLGSCAGNSTTGIIGDIQEVCYFNKALTNAEIAYFLRYAWTKYTQTNQFVGMTKMPVTDGNSYVYGTGIQTGLSNSWFEKLMVTKGVPITGYCSMAVPSRLANTMAAAAVENYAGWSAAMGGVLIRSISTEFYNQPDADASGFLSFLTNQRAADPTIRNLVWTPWDNGATSGGDKTNRLPWAAAVRAATTKWEVLLDVTLNDARLGAEGACLDSPGPYAGTDWADLTHLRDSGQDYFRTLIDAPYDALMAL